VISSTAACRRVRSKIVFAPRELSSLDIRLQEDPRRFKCRSSSRLLVRTSHIVESKGAVCYCVRNPASSHFVASSCSSLRLGVRNRINGCGSSWLDRRRVGQAARRCVRQLVTITAATPRRRIRTRRCTRGSTATQRARPCTRRGLIVGLLVGSSGGVRQSRRTLRRLTQNYRRTASETGRRCVFSTGLFVVASEGQPVCSSLRRPVHHLVGLLGIASMGRSMSSQTASLSIQVVSR